MNKEYGLITSIAPAPAPVLPDSPHRITRLPILILFPHNRCNCRCVMCDIWKLRETKQWSKTNIEAQLQSFRDLGVEWLVLSGGEPLLNEDLGEILEVLRPAKIRVTLLSTGLLLKERVELIAKHVDEVILSLDGPREIHNRIRRIPDAFERIEEGVATLHALRPNLPIRARCTLQKSNHRYFAETVAAAKNLGLQSISFLAADTSSLAFNRPEGWNEARQGTVQLSLEEIQFLVDSIHSLWKNSPKNFSFIRESPEKLDRILDRFRSKLGLCEAVAPRCNAPWVSTVVEADGTVRPCFFHEPIGNLYENSLDEILNGDRGMSFRSQLDISRNDICRNCVCSLYRTPSSAQ